jgi:hypothetical protein
MDVKAQIEKVVETVTKNDGLKKKFLQDPVAAVEEILGTALPKDAAEQVVTAVKAKISADQLAGAADALGKLFSK